MNILALETSGKSGTVAALRDDELLLELPLDPSQRSAQSLVPAVKQLLQTVGWLPNQVELIALPVGPGSFTGLRIGVITAKTLAYATGAAVLGLDTLELIAAQAANSGITGADIIVALSAQRRQAFTATYRPVASGELETVRPLEIRDIETWLAMLPAGGCVTGPLLELVGERVPADVRLAPRTLWEPRAAEVGRLAVVKYAGGGPDDVWSLVPRYYRKSAAEEKANGG